MLSPPDIAVIGVLALIFFGPDQLPKVARKAGQVMREVQNTSQSFIREMERAADDMDLQEAFKAQTPEPEPGLARPATERLAEPSPALAHQAATDPDPRPEVAHEDASGI